MPATGGSPTRLTFHSNSEIPVCFTPDGKSIIYRATILPDVHYTQFPNSAQMYRIPVEGGRPEQFLTFEAYDIHFNKKGDRIVYHDRKGYEDNWRKHHTSSVTRDIWLHDLKTGKFTNITNKEVEDRNPIFTKDEKSIYFLSERFGDFNVCKLSLEDPSQVKQLTKHRKHPVRFLSMSDNGTLCYFYNGEIYTCKEGEQPQKLTIQITTDEIEPSSILQNLTYGATEMALSPNAKEIAFVLRGDIFVSSVEYGTTRRITNTPTQERSVSFSPDGRSLVYAGERNGGWNIYVSSLTDSTDRSFTYAKEIKESQITNSKNALFPTGFFSGWKRDRLFGKQNRNQSDPA